MPLIFGTEEIHFCEDELETATTNLRAQLALFRGGEDSCPSGLMRLLMDDTLTRYDYNGYSVSSTTLTSDGERNGDYGREQHQGSNHPYGASSYSSHLDTAQDHTDDADAVASAGGRSYADAGPSSLETGHDGDIYGYSYVATFLRSSRPAAAAADAATAAAAREAADDDDAGLSFHALGHEFEEYSSHENDGDNGVFSASAAAAEGVAVAGGERAPSAFFVAPEFADYHWPAGAEDVSESSGDGFAYYYKELSRFSEDARAASESARAAVYASAAYASAAGRYR